MTRSSEIPSTGEPIHFPWRERQVLDLLCALYSNKQIADELGLCVATVKSHITLLLRKLGLYDRTELIAWACQHEEDVRQGYTRNPGLHPAGCDCDAGYCTSRRRMKAA